MLSPNFSERCRVTRWPRTLFPAPSSGGENVPRPLCPGISWAGERPAGLGGGLAGDARAMSILPLSGRAADIHDGQMTPTGLHRVVAGVDTGERRIDRRRRLETFQSTRLQPEEKTTKPSTL